MELGRWLLVLGLILALVGALLLYAPRLLGWFGHLPGDIRIERDGVRVYVPLASMLVLSVLLTLVLNLVAFLLALFGRDRP